MLQSSSYAFQLLPYETSLLISANQRVNAPSGTSAQSNLKFTLTVLNNSGSSDADVSGWWDTSTNEPDFQTVSGGSPTSPTLSLISSQQNRYAFWQGDESVNITIPEAAQAKMCRLVVTCRNQRTGGGGQVQSFMKGLSVTATRALSVASAGNPATIMPTKGG